MPASGHLVRWRWVASAAVDFYSLAAKWAREGIDAPPLIGVTEDRLGPNVSSLEIMTTNGCVVCLRHTAPGTDHDGPTPFTTFFLGGALGGLSAGGGNAFGRLAKDFGGVRIHYRLASRLDECLIDVMMVNHHLSKRYGLERVALMGHSFGGGVAPAGGVLLGPHCAGVVAVAGQRVGTELIERLEGKPVLLIHGANDSHIPYQSAHQVYQRAKEPKEMWLIPGGDHVLADKGDEIYERLAAFIRQVSEPS
jgi:pimeloyl-ACP methyl ester carboxylesterase